MAPPELLLASASPRDAREGRLRDRPSFCSPHPNRVRGLRSIPQEWRFRAAPSPRSNGSGDGDDDAEPENAAETRKPREPKLTGSCEARARTPSGSLLLRAAALTGLEARVGLADHVDLAATPHDAAIRVAHFRAAQRVDDLHSSTPSFPSSRSVR